MAERQHNRDEVGGNSPHPFVEEIDYNEIKQLEVMNIVRFDW